MRADKRIRPKADCPAVGDTRNAQQYFCNQNERRWRNSWANFPLNFSVLLPAAHVSGARYALDTPDETKCLPYASHKENLGKNGTSGEWDDNGFEFRNIFPVAWLDASLAYRPHGDKNENFIFKAFRGSISLHLKRLTLQNVHRSIWTVRHPPGMDRLWQTVGIV